MKHVDLFSGICGFALAAQWVWGSEYKNVCFCDIEPFAQQFIKKRFNNPKIYEDIRQIKGNDLGAVDILTGGFPCQPFSVAGKRNGKEDNRYLWPEMLRIIKECKPTWVIGENVAGLTNMVQYNNEPELDDKGYPVDEVGTTWSGTGQGILKEILESLGAEGYEVQPFVIPACAVNAPHRRDRIWIVAYSNKLGCVHGKSKKQSAKGGEQTQHEFIGCDRDGTDTTSNGCKCRRGDREERHIPETEKRKIKENKSERTRRIIGACKDDRYVKNSMCKRSSGWCKDGRQVLECQSSEDKIAGSDCKSWDRHWLEVATELCGVDDGLPAELDGFKLSKSKHRADRLKALGNAIVPQVVYEIMKTIAEVDRNV